jgi:hypothetical protein
LGFVAILKSSCWLLHYRLLHNCATVALLAARCFRLAVLIFEYDPQRMQDAREGSCCAKKLFMAQAKQARTRDIRVLVLQDAVSKHGSRVSLASIEIVNQSHSPSSVSRMLMAKSANDRNKTHT